MFIWRLLELFILWLVIDFSLGTYSHYYACQSKYDRNFMLSYDFFVSINCRDMDQSYPLFLSNFPDSSSKWSLTDLTVIGSVDADRILLLPFVILRIRTDMIHYPKPYYHCIDLLENWILKCVPKKICNLWHCLY